MWHDTLDFTWFHFLLFLAASAALYLPWWLAGWLFWIYNIPKQIRTNLPDQPTRHASLTHLTYLSTHLTFPPTWPNHLPDLLTSQPPTYITTHNKQITSLNPQITSSSLQINFNSCCELRALQTKPTRPTYLPDLPTWPTYLPTKDIFYNSDTKWQFRNSCTVFHTVFCSYRENK